MNYSTGLDKRRTVTLFDLYEFVDRLVHAESQKQQLIIKFMFLAIVGLDQCQWAFVIFARFLNMAVNFVVEDDNVI